jgi:hypothetical protein
MDLDLEVIDEQTIAGSRSHRSRVRSHSMLQNWKHYLPRLDSVLEPPPDIAANWYNREQDEEEHAVRQFIAIALTWSTPLSDDNIDGQFKVLAARWHEETTHMSSVAQKVAHPSYREIIKLGATHRERVLSLILKDLRRRAAFWFAALETISGHHLVADHSDPNKERQIWLNWGKQKAYL